jgi:hypothetical protein
MSNQIKPDYHGQRVGDCHDWKKSIKHGVIAGLWIFTGVVISYLFLCGCLEVISNG